MRAHALFLVAALAACADRPAGTGHGTGVETDDRGPVLPIDHPPLGTGGGAGGGGVTAGPASGGSQRLTVAQLRQSLPVVLGSDAAGAPVTWKVGTAVGFDVRSATLGEADYLNRVDDDLEPSPLYVKFMFDMARDSCNRALVADAARPQAQRTLTRWVGTTDTVQSAPAAVDKNLRALKLAFHGVKVADTDDAGIASYRKLFDDAVKAAAGGGSASAANVAEGWRTVCVGLLTAPEYHFY